MFRLHWSISIFTMAFNFCLFVHGIPGIHLNCLLRHFHIKLPKLKFPNRGCNFHRHYVSTALVDIYIYQQQCSISMCPKSIVRFPFCPTTSFDLQLFQPHFPDFSSSQKLSNNSTNSNLFYTSLSNNPWQPFFLFQKTQIKEHIQSIFPNNNCPITFLRLYPRTFH